MAELRFTGGHTVAGNEARVGLEGQSEPVLNFVAKHDRPFHRGLHVQPGPPRIPGDFPAGQTGGGVPERAVERREVQRGSGDGAYKRDSVPLRGGSGRGLLLLHDQQQLSGVPPHGEPLRRSRALHVDGEHRHVEPVLVRAEGPVRRLPGVRGLRRVRLERVAGVPVPEGVRAEESGGVGAAGRVGRVREEDGAGVRERRVSGDEGDEAAGELRGAGG